MKSKFIEVCDVRGKVISQYQVDEISSLPTLTDGYLLIIDGEVLLELGSIPDDQWLPEESRVICTKSPQQKQLLLNLAPTRVYLRLPNMTSTILYVNPYHTVKWLKKYITQAQDLTYDLKLILNQEEMEDKDTLINYLHENAIIHIIDQGCFDRSDVIESLYVKEPPTEAEVYEITHLAADSLVDTVVEKVSTLLGIPMQSLHLVYAGQILNKQRTLDSYSVRNGMYIYAVDARKYLKVVTKAEYQARVQQVRKQAQAITKLLHTPAPEPVQQQSSEHKQPYKKKHYDDMDVEESQELNYFKNMSDEDVLRKSQPKQPQSASSPPQQTSQTQQSQKEKQESQQNVRNSEKSAEKEEVSLYMSEQINVLVDSVRSGEELLLSSKQQVEEKPKQADKNEQFFVNITDEQHEKHQVMIHQKDSIDDVVQKYARVRNIKPDKIQIFFDGSVLEDQTVVNQLQIKPDSNLYAMIKH